MDFHAPVQRALAAAGVNTAAEPLVSMLRTHVSTSSVSHHIAQHSKSKVQERASQPEIFGQLHDELRAQGVAELDKFTIFLQRVADERAVVEMLRITAKGSSSLNSARAAGPSASSSSCASSSSSAPGWALNAAAAAAAAPGTAVPGVAGGPSSSLSATAAAAPSASAPYAPTAAWESGWLLSRPYLSGNYLAHGVREQLVPEPPPASASSNARGGAKPAAASERPSALGALPVAEQESVLVGDLLRVLAGVEGTHIRTAPAPPSSLDGVGGGLVAREGAAHRIKFHLPTTPAPASGSGGAAGLDPSLRDLAHRLLPLGERYLALSRFVHARSASLESGLVMHAMCAALRACLHEHLVGLAQLEQQHTTSGISLQQLWYYLQPAARSLAILDEVVSAVGGARGGALLKALHERRLSLAGDAESAELLDYLLARTAAPFLEMLGGWVDRGVCHDPYGEFMVVERPNEARDDLVTDFNCQYWQRRFHLAPAQVPAFLAPHAEEILTTGKSLHVVRECGRLSERAGAARACGRTRAPRGGSCRW